MIVIWMSVVLNIIECITQYRPLFHLCQNWFYLFCFVYYQFLVWVYISTCVIYFTQLSLSCSISCCNVSVLIILPDSTFLFTCLACSSVKYKLSLGLFVFTCPPILVLRGKNAVRSFLPSIHLNVLVLDYLLNLCSCHACLLLTVLMMFACHLKASAGVVLILFPP